VSDFYIVAALYAKEGHEAELQRRLFDLVEHSRQDEGNLSYDLFADQADPRRFVLVEHWASPETRHRHHTQTEHIRRFEETAADVVERSEFFSMLDRLA
jgi:quinol monooxygenase YgiN